MQNWAKTVQYQSSKCLYPRSVLDVVAIMKDPSLKKVKVLATGHTFNQISDVGDKTGVFVSLQYLNDVVVIGNEAKIGAGVNYSKLIEELVKAKKAIENVPSLPHVNVVGSLVTGTHGSGYHKPMISSYVTQIEIVLANGDVRLFKRSEMADSHFFLYLLNFGTLGIITSITIQVKDEFKILKRIYENLSWEELKDPKQFHELMQVSEYLSLFCQWKDRKMDSVWCAFTEKDNEGLRKWEDANAKFYGATHIKAERIHPCGYDASACVTSGWGSWNNKIYHFLPDKPPSSAGNEMHSEYFVHVNDFVEAIESLYQIKDQFQHLVQVNEFRMCCQDSTPFSPAKGRPVVGIHFTWKKAPQEVLGVLPAIEKVLAKFTPSVHYGKMFLQSRSHLEKLFGWEMLALRELQQKLDPSRKFQNDFTKRYIGHEEGAKL